MPGAAGSDSVFVTEARQDSAEAKKAVGGAEEIPIDLLYNPERLSCGGENNWWWRRWRWRWPVTVKATSIVAAVAAIVIVVGLCVRWLIKFGPLELPVLMRYPLATPNLVIFC